MSVFRSVTNSYYPKGSSAIQIVPALQPKVAHLVNYAKGKTWISSTFVRDQILQLSGGKDVVNCKEYATL